MASTYSTNLAIELIGTGDQAGTWGATTNTNLGTLIEQAISGYVTQAVATGTDTTITIPNGATGVARNMYIELTGTGGAATNLIVPTNRKLYFIYNNTTGQVTVKVTGQTGISVPAGAKVILVSNGTDIVNATDYIRGDSANITVLTSSSATITNLLGTTLSFGSASLSNADILSATITSATITGAGITSAAITTLTGTTLGYGSASLSNLKAVSAVITSATITGAGITSAAITTLTGTTVSYGSASLTNLNVSSSATLARFSAGSSAVSNLLASGAITAVGNISTSGNLSASGSITASSGSITQLTSTSATITTLKATSATIDNVSITSYTVANATITSANITTLTGTTLGYASASITTVTGTTIGAALSSTILGISGAITTLTGTSADITTITGLTIGTTASSTIRGVSGVVGQFNSTSATITTLTGTTIGYGSASISNAKLVSSVITTLTATSSTITTLTGTTLTYTSGTVTNLNSTSANITTLTGTTFGTTATTQLRGASAQITTLTATSSNITTLTSASATITNLINSGGTANGVLYLNGSKVATSGSALTFDGTNFATTGNSRASGQFLAGSTGAATPDFSFIADNTLGIFRAPNALGFSIAGSEQMRLTSTGLGIGTSSPFAKLQVVASSADYFNPQLMIGEASNSTGKQLHVGYNTTANTGYIQAVHNGTGYKDLLLNPNGGNLGLGVTPSAWNTSFKALQVSNSVLYNNGAADTFLGANFYNDTSGTNRYITSSQAAAYGQVDGAHQWYTAASGTAGNAISFTQAMTLDASGNLDLGTTGGVDRYQNIIATSAKLSFNAGTGFTGSAATSIYNQSAIPMVFGTNNTERARITAGGDFGIGSTSPAFALGSGLEVERAGIATLRLENSSGSNSIEIAADSTTNGIRFYGLNNAPFVFAPNATERARITSGGDLLVGTTTNTNNYKCNFQFSGASINGLIVLNNSSTGAPQLLFLYDSAQTVNNTEASSSYEDTTAQRWSLRKNGGLANYQVNNVNLSDQRVKKDVKPLGSMWDKFKAIEIVTFKYKDQTHDDDNIGVIAQQVESVAPEFIDVDGFGETPEDGVPLKTVYTTDMYHAAIKALQEAMARIEQLEAKVAALETK